MKPYIWHIDSSHGWLAVKTSELKDLDLINKISSYSYISKSAKTVYLEEDVDAGLFIKAKQERSDDIDENGKLITTENYKDGRSTIRNLEQFSELQLAVNEKYHR